MFLIYFRQFVNFSSEEIIKRIEKRDYNTYYEIPYTYKKYYINKKGIVKDKYGYTLMTTIRKGYITVTLTLNSVRVRKSINNLMLVTFFKDYTKMYYIDDNKLNLDIINIICK